MRKLSTTSLLILGLVCAVVISTTFIIILVKPINLFESASLQLHDTYFQFDPLVLALTLALQLYCIYLAVFQSLSRFTKNEINVTQCIAFGVLSITLFSTRRILGFLLNLSKLLLSSIRGEDWTVYPNSGTVPDYHESFDSCIGLIPGAIGATITLYVILKTVRSYSSNKS